ncbi:TetR/AcrR family transcriptional regulator [Saccharomonospora sp. NPDC046836]|uniref:TetR/AcrR family transcriptional regulator n=1 Tax=Saccharomonospora sp. NPDC046836 TaxID=3156921 RepID=UPI0034096887
MTKRLRADAQRNRDDLVAAARTLFGERGIDVPLDEVAHRAGVGIGTLYRRFPDREALIEAVAIDTVGRLTEIAETELSAGPDAWTALVGFLRRAVELRIGVLLSVLTPQLPQAAHGRPALRAARQELIGLLDRMVAGAQAHGVLRTDVGSGDIAVLLSMLVRELPGLPDAVADAVPVRFLELVLDGLRTRPGSALASGPVTAAELVGDGEP